MSIQEDLLSEMKTAMKARDKSRLDVIRMIRSKVQEATTASGFSGEVDDALHMQVIALYCKQMQKAIPDYESQGERGAEMIQKLQYEIDYLSKYLPQKLGEEETRALVAGIVSELGATDRSQMGRVMGMVMKNHRDEVDGGLVKRLVDEALSG